MTTIVFHSSSLGVTEYDQTFRGLAGDFEANDDGVFHVEGSADEAAAFVSRFTVGVGSADQTAKRVPMSAHLMADSESVLNATVSISDGLSYTYPEQLRTQRMRRFIFGRGIRDNYLGFSFFNPDGEPFKIDRVTIETRDSAQRKV